MKINQKSDYLVILLPTYNRLESLKKAIDSVLTNTKCSRELIIIDGGSTDGTIEYLKNQKNITPVFQNQLWGGPKACNEVWKNVECKYTAPFADDEECLPGAFDLGASILEKNLDIGMVGLKIKDLAGPKKLYSFNGGVFSPGILGISQPVCRMDILKAMGFFDERFVSYRADADLTASMLCVGKKVVMTKKLSILHHRDWAENEEELKRLKKRSNIKESKAILRDKFGFLESVASPWHKIKERGILTLGKVFAVFSKREWEVIAKSKFISIYDGLFSVNKSYYLTQQIPEKFLKHPENPHRHLINML